MTITMRFITLQDTPKKQWVDENGVTQSEATTFNNISVPVNESLGFKPMWAIPITTFKETLASVLLVAANYPQYVCIFETDDYVRVDKVAHYQNLKDDITEIPLADDDLPEHLVEYCLNIESLPEKPELMGSVLAVESILKDGVGFDKALDVFSTRDMNTGHLVALNGFTADYLKRFPQFDEASVAQSFEDLGMGNADIRARLFINWLKYKLTILPMVLWSLCDDTKSPMLSDKGIEVKPWIMESCASNLKKIMDLDVKMAKWSQEDCSRNGFDYIHNQVMDFILDSEPVMKSIYLNGKIGRNDSCPCGSGKKYKKCHA